MYVNLCWSANTGCCPCVGVHRRMSIMSSSLYLQLYSACHVHLTKIVYEMGGKWQYNCCFVRCCFQDLFKTDCSILESFPSSFFSKHFIRVQVVQPYSSIDMATVWKNFRFKIVQIQDVNKYIWVLFEKVCSWNNLLICRWFLIQLLFYTCLFKKHLLQVYITKLCAKK